MGPPSVVVVMLCSILALSTNAWVPTPTQRLSKLVRSTSKVAREAGLGAQITMPLTRSEMLQVAYICWCSDLLGSNNELNLDLLLLRSSPIFDFTSIDFIVRTNQRSIPGSIGVGALARPHLGRRGRGAARES